MAPPPATFLLTSGKGRWIDADPIRKLETRGLAAPMILSNHYVGTGMREILTHAGMKLLYDGRD